MGKTTFKIGEVSKKLEVSVTSLRKWEKSGLIPKPHRTPTGHRIYGHRDIEEIKKHLNKN